MPPTSSAITGMPLKLAGSLLQLRNSRSAARCGFGQKTRPSSDILAHQRPCIIVPPWPGKDQSGPCKMWELKWDQIFRNSTLSCKNNTIKWLTGAQERTRTSTALRPLAPEASASTNSTTWARGDIFVARERGARLRRRLLLVNALRGRHGQFSHMVNMQAGCDGRNSNSLWR